MKDDLKRLMNEFLQETIEFRTIEVDKQLTSDMPAKKNKGLREPTLLDFIWWLNDEFPG